MQENVNNDPPIIVTDYCVEKLDNGKPTGLWNWHSQRSVVDVIAQLKVILATIRTDDGTALEFAEWITPEYDDENREFPRGEPFAAMRHGSNEGYLVHIFSFDRQAGNIHPVIAIKYLTDKDFTYRVAKVVNEALYDGGFICEERKLKA